MLGLEFDPADLDDSKKEDLDSMLPRLARRIQSKQKRTTYSSDGTIISVINPAGNESARVNTGSSRKRNTRRSVNGSICYSAANLPAEIAAISGQDIYHDPDSAAERAFSALAHMSEAPAPDAGAKPAESAGGASAAAPASTAANTTPSASSGQRVEGREVQQDHAQYALTYGMMLGIRVTTGRRESSTSTASGSAPSSPTPPPPPASVVSCEEERELQPDDYAASTKLLFRPEGGTAGGQNPFPTPSHKLPFAFAFKDYAPEVFRALRAMNNIDEADYLLALAGDFNYIEFLANSKSGQFFFYSHDGRFMIKTQSREEAKLLRELLPKYVNHLAENPDSLLTRFYALHRVKMPTLQRQTFFVVMQSVFHCHGVSPALPLHVKYDLKGSTVGRVTEPADCASGAVQKDVNFLQAERRLVLGPERGRLFAKTLVADTYFLRDLRIMDYSLLLGVYDPSEERMQLRKRAKRMQSGGSLSSRRSSCGVVLSSKRLSVVRPAASSSSSTEVRDSLGFVYTEPAAQSLGVAGSVFASYHGGVLAEQHLGEEDADVHDREVYYLGIIDILQVYNTNKRLENFFKGFSHDRTQLSAVDPALYADRMCDFLLRRVTPTLSNDEVRDIKRSVERQRSVENHNNNSNSNNSSNSTQNTQMSRQRANTTSTASTQNTQNTAQTPRDRDRRRSTDT